MDENLNITCKIDRQQVTPNGFEFDINSTLSSNNEIVWENINTYYFRGKYGIPEKVILNFNSLPMSDDYSKFYGKRQPVVAFGLPDFRAILMQVIIYPHLHV